MNYYVYMFTNKITKKKYIGSTSDVNRRYQQHLRASKDNKSKSYNYPLQLDLRFYGESNFDFDILESFDSVETAQEYELRCILKHNSVYPNGYNQTINTSQYKTYLNQLEVEIIKIREEKIPFKVDWNDITAAGNTLAPSAFKLFLYLSKNKDGYSFYLSPKDFISNFEMSYKTYQNARVELIEKGYLIQDGNELIFDSKGGLNIDPERLREQILELDKELETIDMQAEIEYKEYLTKKNLKQFKEDNVPISLYIAALKEALNHGYEIKNKYSSVELKDII